MVVGERKKMRENWAWGYSARDLTVKKYNKTRCGKTGRQLSGQQTAPGEEELS